MNPIKRNTLAARPVLVLFVLMFTGIGVMMWFAPVPDEDITSTQANLITIADWMVKVSVGALLGLVGAGRMRPNGG